jgi:hypothetical protein
MIHKNYIDRQEAITLKEWIVSYLLLSIPVVGVIFAIYWAFSDQTKISKQTWAQCILIFYAFFILLFVVLEFGFSINVSSLWKNF